MNGQRTSFALLVVLSAIAGGAAPRNDDDLWSREVPRVAGAREFFIAADGKPAGSGGRESPWDLASTLSGQQKVPPGSILWVRGGRYVYPVRHSQKGGNGFALRLKGEAGKPIHLRAWPGERATIDGGLDVAAQHVWIWDLEIALGDTWRPETPHPQGAQAVFDVPTGIVNITGDDDVKLIDCVCRRNIMGVGFWRSVRNGEIHGCIVIDNGYPGADRPHGPALYTQNVTGTPRRVTDNIFAGNFSLGLQCYGSRIDELVNDFIIEGNIEYAPRKEAGRRNYNQIGGEFSKGMVLKNNVFHGYGARLGTKADQVGEGNLVIRASYDGPTPGKNTLIADPSKAPPIAILRPNKYDPRRAHAVISDWDRKGRVDVPLGTFLKKGERYRIMDPLDFYGKPLAEGVFEGNPVVVGLPEPPWPLLPEVPREIGVFVIIKGP